MTTGYRHIAQRWRTLALLAGTGAFLAWCPAQANERDAQLAAISRLIEAHYAFPEKQDAVLAKLAQSLDEGRYASIDDRAFAMRVTEDLRAASNDQHMSLVHDPARSESLAARPKPADPGPDAAAFQARLNRAGNYGLAELKILEGNVRYLDARAFAWTEGAAESAYDAAARFLQDADAIIVDLRGNTGGEPMAVRRMLSYLEKPGTPLYRLYVGPKARDIASADIPQAASLAGKPLYLLTARDSVSAAEAFAYHVSAAGLGEIVGEKTMGAANISDLFALAPGFVLTISVGRATHAITGTDWEGTGVAPSIAVPFERALAVAHVRALESWRDSADARQRPAFEFDLRTTRARLDPVPQDARQLQRYVGVYGNRRVSLRDNRLVWKSHQQPEVALEPLDRDWFQISPRTQARFVTREGGVVAVELHRPSGETTLVERTAP